MTKRFFFILIMSCITLEIFAIQSSFYFEFNSQGTHSRINIKVIIQNKKVHYKTTNTQYPQKVIEEWTGILKDSDYQEFIRQIIHECRFMDLPSTVTPPVLIKDAPNDYFTVIHGKKTHKVGAYAARYHPEYKKVYDTFNTIYMKVTELKYIKKNH